MDAPGAFLCYARDDDEAEGGAITTFRDRLQDSVRFAGVVDFEIFQDRDSIQWSERWRAAIDGALDSTTLLIPILTPRWFTRPECFRELERFAERERTLGRDDLILGVYWYRTDLLDDPAAREGNPVATDLAARQLHPWHQLRYEPWTSPARMKALDQMALRIKVLLRLPEAGGPTSSSSVTTPGAPAPEPGRAAEVAAPAPRGTIAVPDAPVKVVDPFPRRGWYTTIADAMAGAEPGDRIVVRPGTYDEGIVLEQPLEIVGDGPVDEIVVRGEGIDTVVMSTTIARVANLTLVQTGGEDCYGVYVPTGRLTLEDCVITSQSLSGVAVGGGEATMRRNRIASCKEAGITVYDNAVGVIEDNDITDNTLAGIDITTGANPTVRRNRITNGKQSGIYVHENGLGVIEDNDITDNERSGIEIATGANPTIRRNRITQHEQNGIYVQEDGLGVIEDNDISDNTLGGISIRAGANPTVRRNRITNGKQGGILFYESGLGVIEDNDITDNTLAGIEIRTGANPTVRGNRITNGKQGGIYVHDHGLGVIEDNDISDNTRDGIEIATDANPTISGNRVHRNERGVFIRKGAKATITDNDLRENRDSALHIDKAALPDVTQENNVTE